MPDTDIGSAIASDLTSVVTDYSVDPQNTDATTGQREYEYINQKWSDYLGYYKTIPELGTVIDARATWTVGKGFIADPVTEILLGEIRGRGNETFNEILENMIRTYMIGGDSYAEIIRDKNDILINLKILDPGVMKVIGNANGQIIRYEQISKIKGKSPKKFKPEKIFHLTRNRVADEIHGISVIEKLEPIILMRNESMADYRTVMHRFVKPRYFFHLDTDDPTEIASFKSKYDAANENGENFYIPKGAVVPELVAVSPNATLNPQAWIESLNDYFYEACNTPKIIVGGAKGFTEAAVKIVYLAFQQNVEEEQLYIEEQALAQLNLVFELEFPASLENELISDKAKDVESGAVKPEDTKVMPVEPAQPQGVTQ